MCDGAWGGAGHFEISDEILQHGGLNQEAELRLKGSGIYKEEFPVIGDFLSV